MQRYAGDKATNARASIIVARAVDGRQCSPLQAVESHSFSYQCVGELLSQMEQVSRWQLGSSGLDWDRTWQFLDSTGQVLNQKLMPAMTSITASVTLPDLDGINNLLRAPRMLRQCAVL